MVLEREVINDAGMTDSNAEQSSAPPASATRISPLRRRATDRVGAGVASGIADYLNVDPLLIRVAFVGLVLFNGAGFFIYLAAWLFIPVEDGDTSIVEGWIRGIGVNAATAGTLTWVVLAIIGTMLLFGPGMEDGAVSVRPIVGFAVALVVIAGGILLVRRTASADAYGVADHPKTDELSGAAAPSAPTSRERRTRVKRERSPLGLYVLGLLLLTVGVLTAVDVGTTATILPGQYAGVALSVLGLGLVVGAWVGRARWLILVGLLLVPPALALGFVTVPLDGDWGERRTAPTSATELRDDYHLAGGHLTLDLSDLPSSTADRQIAASIGFGELVVILPEGARAEVTTEIGAGSSDLLGARQEGTGLADRQVHDGTGGALVLDLEAGIGSVLVRTAHTGE